MEIFDLLLDDDQELVAVNDDFRTGDASNNIIKYIVVSHIGNWKEFSLPGVGIEDYLNSNVTVEEIESTINTALAADVFKNPAVDASNFPSTVNINKTAIEFN